MRTNLIENRHIRVFISSTFQDMQDERDYLMRHTFPTLRRIAAERDVTLTELDLRWGITEEEAQNGKVVEICLQEIENSIPFFVGIIGNRYGWIPGIGDIGPDIMDRFPEVSSYVGRHLSVTEMEMQFGVLDRAEEGLHAYFYIKDSMQEPADHPERLQELKDRALSSIYPSHYYSSVEDLAAKVEADFMALLDSLFPDTHLSKWEKERLGQRSFMNQLCQNYIRDEESFGAIDDWLHDEDKRELVITGASGMGKSALIANWLNEKLQDKEKDYSVAYYFTGNGGGECSSIQIMESLSGEIREQLMIDEPKKQKPSEDLENLFGIVGASGKRLLIVIDAINQILDIDSAKRLEWLPVPPDNIKILFSTLEDDPTMDLFRAREYPTLHLNPLSDEKRRLMVNSYLNLFAKRLTDTQVTKIITDSQCGNTLVLKTLLDELIAFGIYERLDEKIESYLHTGSIEDFYKTVLGMKEEEYGQGLVRDALCLIAVSKNGLTEHQILSITGVKPIRWSQFFSGFFAHFTSKNGKIGFSHTYVANAVWQKYLSGDSDSEKKYRNAIIRNMADDPSFESIIERTYQLDRCDQIEGLYNLLSNRATIHEYLSYDDLELAKYWKRIAGDGIQAHTVRDIAKPDKTDELAEYYSDIIRLLDSMSDMKTAKELCPEFLEVIEKHNLSVSNETYKLMGTIMNQPYYLEFAERVLRDCLERYGEDHDETISAYGFLGNAWYDMGVSHNKEEYYNKAFEAWQSKNTICKKLHGEYHPDVASSYRDMALVAPNPEKCLEYSLKSIRLTSYIFGEHNPMTGWSLNHTGCVYLNMKDYEKAFDCFHKSGICWESAYGEVHHLVAASLNNQGHALIRMDKLDEGLELLVRAMNIRRKVYGEAWDYSNSCISVGNVLRRKGDLDQSLLHLTKAKEILVRENNRPRYIKQVMESLLLLAEEFKSNGRNEVSAKIAEDVCESTRLVQDGNTDGDYEAIREKCKGLL